MVDVFKIFPVFIERLFHRLDLETSETLDAI